MREVRERKEWGDTAQAGPATMTGRAWTVATLLDTTGHLSQQNGEDSINPTKTPSLKRLTSISHKIHSQTPQAFAAGARLAAHRQSTRDHHGESLLDKPVAHMYCMWLHK